MHDILERAARIKMVIFDVDGVLTDGGLFLGDDGLEYKAFNSKDGHGMKMLQESGVIIAIITGRSSQVVAMRMESLGIQHVYQGLHDKLPAYLELAAKLDIADEEVAYVGDDVVDLPIMRRIGLAVAVQDAHDLVRQHAHWHTAATGGRGAAREVCELIMQAQGTLQPMFDRYL
ncbi:MAG: 3-deoxy-D-manno-octulosonate 8-phosphate phosphatase [Candidatus Sedimenticola endophacoides]|uniref:3-deoxy-D-manno-octulosonate 8-phosphate phosphatase KdsC n=1 Tax=Candidatus Sedimenticola endophacoides TaxID=2548426 RepID=A0A657Q3R8_9GAMM|nr:MAG: 3-deoxy-D-manno-octulosonate 8-phosphate phosphatase [Candidatus Sedimenticola endophacoides]OQX35646.1 MAG: 3-deoxy-D-manno-octulosonate 8-phosphate phosphatase [Candidatus Sedimenticola endophacoides]OQX40451.1 MAG: 3-deoxy-D-manno-octulosonate 8-phosphate phosphatase [Candidatus Sedimenticola endophacoides]OQX44896.1 MAG: 3-deoxy-D-manno-octulosonate 8-phosphate phosphatase [Candidatus Sedimenticola endophacoides]OQX47074.1 MAG: 3-deoxy-D-manno-octulosonate 8-phosphate phosphatase [C